MRILLDHNLDWRLWEPLQPHEVVTTGKMQWADYDNGKLLNVAQLEFDVLLTVDTNIYHQQNVARYQIAVIVLRAYDNSYESLLPLLPEVMSLLTQNNPARFIMFTPPNRCANVIGSEAKALPRNSNHPDSANR